MGYRFLRCQGSHRPRRAPILASGGRSPIKFAVIDFRTLLIRCTCPQVVASTASRVGVATNSTAVPKETLKKGEKKTNKRGRRGFGKLRPHPLLASQLSDLAKASSSSSPPSYNRISNPQSETSPLFRASNRRYGREVSD